MYMSVVCWVVRFRESTFIQLDTKQLPVVNLDVLNAVYSTPHELI